MRARRQSKTNPQLRVRIWSLFKAHTQLTPTDTAGWDKQCMVLEEWKQGKRELPFVLCRRQLEVMKQLLWSLRVEQNVLLVGRSGCGKSQLLDALAWLLGEEVESLSIIPDTEPSALVGQYAPGSGSGAELVEWVPGVVTRACQMGRWALLNNLSLAESTTLERLNPVLESPPVLVLTEKDGQARRETVSAGYRLFATMTPPLTGGDPSQGAELSPALCNRFTIIFMDDLQSPNKRSSASVSQPSSSPTSTDAAHTNGGGRHSDAAADATKQELTALAAVLLLGNEEAAPRAVGVSVELCELLMARSSCFPPGSVDVRMYTRLLHCAVLLHSAYQAELPDVVHGLWAAFLAVCDGKLLRRDDSSRANAADLSAQVQALLATGCGVPPGDLRVPRYDAQVENQEHEHILTASRASYARQVLSAVACRLAVLLEGPAAAGKTSLIAALASGQGGRSLQRVNNTASTSIVDYMGSYLPIGGRIEFQPGPLYHALLEGHFFLADELNLADPATMAMLFSILEGATEVAVPGTELRVAVHPSFRFFATQNPADGQYKGRFRLPATLRSRFIEVTFVNFTEEELRHIIERRSDEQLPRGSNVPSQAALYMARIYHNLLQDRAHAITLRQIVKWARRVHRQHQHGNNTHSLGDNWLSAGWTLLSSAIASPASEQRLLAAFRSAQRDFMAPGSAAVARIATDAASGRVRFSVGDSSALLPNVDLSRSKLFAGGRTPPQPFVLALVRLALAVDNHEPVLLVGPSSFKTRLIHTWCAITNRKEHYTPLYLTADSEPSALIGDIRPVSLPDLLRLLPTWIKHTLERWRGLRSSGSSSRPHANLANERTLKVAGQLDDRLTGRSGEVSLAALLQSYLTTSASAHQAASAQAAAAADDSAAAGEAAAEDDDRVMMERVQMAAWARDEDARYETNPFADPFAAPMEQAEDAAMDDAVDDPFAMPDGDAPAEPPAEEKQVEADADADGDLDPFGTRIAPAEPQPTIPWVEQTESGALVQRFQQFMRAESDTEQLIRAAGGDRQQGGGGGGGVGGFGEQLREAMRVMLDGLKELAAAANDRCLHVMVSKLDGYWTWALAECTSRESSPLFLFKDGPVSTAVRLGRIVVLEDFDLPSANVSERLNSLLETSAFFNISEDFTVGQSEPEASHHTALQRSVAPLPTMQIFATVHQEPGQEVNISPAARSRFTVIQLEAYTELEMVPIYLQRLRRTFLQASSGHAAATAEEQAAAAAHSEQLLHLCCTIVFSVRRALRERTGASQSRDIHQLCRVIRFMKRVPKDVDKAPLDLLLVRLQLVGVRFFYLDELTLSQQAEVIKDVASSGLSSDLLQLIPDPATRDFARTWWAERHQAGASPFLAIFQAPSADQRASFQQPIQLLTTGHIRLNYLYGLAVQRVSEVNLQERLAKLSPTPSIIQNMARIFACIIADSPLLLEGPPGNGSQTRAISRAADCESDTHCTHWPCPPCLISACALCCVVLCCAVLCCAVLCCAVLSQKRPSCS